MLVKIINIFSLSETLLLKLSKVLKNTTLMKILHISSVFRNLKEVP